MVLFNHRDYDHYVPAQPAIFGPSWGDPEAFTIHERCWQLMIRMLDVELIRQNMEMFVRAMCEPWVIQDQKPLCYLTRSSQKARQWRDFTSLLPLQYHRSMRACLTVGIEDPGLLNRHFTGADPLNDPYVQNVIYRFTIKYDKEREMGIEKNFRPSIPTHPMSRRSQSLCTLDQVFLPTELILVIADFLEHRNDILAMICVFPRWYPMIPNSYWRRRFIDENCLTSQNYPAADALDWQHIYLNSDRLLRPSPGWRNRQHILTLLRNTKDRFMQKLEENTII